MRITQSLPLLAMSLSITACGGSGDKNTSSADSVDSLDSIAEAPISPLPDTAYASAAAVRYTLEEAMPDVDGHISSLKDLYVDAPGVLMFRGTELRDADFHGTVKGEPTELVEDWVFTTGSDNRPTSHGSWGGGTGWTGQPLYVEWPDSCIARFRKAGTVADNFSGKEIIFGSLASQVYFVDYKTGKASRTPIHVGNPIKGTISLDPTLNGNLYVGQGVPAERPFGAIVIDLYKHQRTHMMGEDPKAQRRWGAYDSSPVRLGQFLFRPGENGVIYKYIVEPGNLRLHTALRYTVNGAAPGIESSMSVFRNYGFTSDNRGNILGINLDTMRPVWHYALGDDTDATPVVVVEDGVPYVYVGCEVDLQDVGNANFVKLNGLDGSLVWKTAVEGRRVNTGEKHFDGGFYASALPGKGDCKDLIFSNVVTNKDGQNGNFIALDRKTGREVYATRLKHYAWSSPVGFLNENNKQFIVTADTYGNLYLIEGKTGKIISTRNMGSNFESSPVVHGNTFVVGTRGSTIFRMHLK